MKNSWYVLLACLGLVISVPGFSKSLFEVDKTRGEWTLFVIPDTQGYIENWREQGYLYSEMVETFQWLQSMVDTMNVQVIQSVGDMVENNNDTEWGRVIENYYPLLEAGVPIIPCAGNHEWRDGGGPGDFAYMNEYFPLSDFENKPWWGGNYPEGEIQNTYQNFTIYGMEYLFITLQYQAGSDQVDAQDAVDWAEGIVESNPDKNIVLSSHWNNRQHHYYQLVEVYPQIRMTLAGHKCAEEYWVDNTNGGETHNFVQDYQCQGISNGPGGLMELRYYIFKPMDDKVEWYTYSATANDGEGQFITRNMDVYEETNDNITALLSSQGSFDFEQDDPPPDVVGVRQSQRKNLFPGIDLSVNSTGPTRQIRFSTTEKSLVSLSLFNSQGRFIKNIYQKTTPSGDHVLQLDITSLISGVYILKGYAGFNSLATQFSVLK